MHFIFIAVLSASWRTPNLWERRHRVAMGKGEKDEVEKLFHGTAKKQLKTKIIHIKEKPNFKRLNANR